MKFRIFKSTNYLCDGTHMWIREDHVVLLQIGRLKITYITPGELVPVSREGAKEAKCELRPSPTSPLRGRSLL